MSQSSLAATGGELDANLLVEPLNLPGWDALVQSADPPCTPFHSAGWLRVLAASYGYRPLALLARRGGALRALVPICEVRSLWTGRRGVSLPFSDLCPPLSFGGDGVPADLIGEILRVGREAGWRYFEQRGGSDGPVAARYLHHELALDAEEPELLRRLSVNHQRSVRKALAGPLEVRFSTSQEALRDFYRLHSRNRRLLGLPPQPFSFFQRLREHVFLAGQGQVIQACLGPRVVASLVFLHFGRTAVYKYGAADPAFLSLRPNHRVMWEAILWYARGGYHRLSFGRTDLEDVGLGRYKLGWGARQETLAYRRYPLLGARTAQPRESAPGGAAFVRGTPLPLLRMIGKVVYRHFG